MHVTEHAIDRFIQRFDRRNMAHENRATIRAYLLRMVGTAMELNLAVAGDTVHKVTHQIVFVIKDDKVITVIEFDKNNYRAKRDKFRYHNCSFWKRHSNGCAYGH